MNNCIGCGKVISKKAIRCIPCNNKKERDYKSVVEKRKKTMLEKHGFENAMYCEEFKNKLKETNLEKYGCENSFQSEEIKEKIRKTNLSKFGVEYPSQSKEIREKIVNTLISNYGVDSPLKSEEILNDMKYNNIEKYGVEHPMRLDDVKNKMLNSRKDKRTYNIEAFREYRDLVNKLTYTSKKILMETWNGYDYYDGEFIKENFKYGSNSPLYPTVDHKNSILYCFNNGISPGESASVDNLCITKRSLNSIKNRKSEIEFRSFLQ